MTNPLAGHTVADLIAYLQQLPQDTEISVLNSDYHDYQGESSYYSKIDNSSLDYSEPWDWKGEHHPGRLEIGVKN